jgi:hypothetical protein
MTTEDRAAALLRELDTAARMDAYNVYGLPLRDPAAWPRMLAMVVQAMREERQSALVAPQVEVLTQFNPPVVFMPAARG